MREVEHRRTYARQAAPGNAKEGNPARRGDLRAGQPGVRTSGVIRPLISAWDPKPACDTQMRNPQESAGAAKKTARGGSGLSRLDIYSAFQSAAKSGRKSLRLVESCPRPRATIALPLVIPIHGLLPSLACPVSMRNAGWTRRSSIRKSRYLALEPA
jgi:hypothetical protein